MKNLQAINQYLMLTDTHINDGNISIVEDLFEQAFSLCKERKIKTIFHLGDWFTSRKGQSQSILLATKRIIERMQRLDITCWIIRGNHDATDLESSESFLDIFECSHFNVVRYEFSKAFGNLTIHFLPYFLEGGSYLARLTNCLPSTINKNILLTHIAVNGVRNNDYSPVSNNLTLDKFDKFDKVFVGHYHNQSNIGHIYYMGSVRQANFGEDDGKGFTILSDDGSFEFIQARFPRFDKILINIDELTIELIDQLRQEKKQSPQDNIRVVLIGDKSKKQSFDRALLTDFGVDCVLEDIGDSISSNEIENVPLSLVKEDILKYFHTFCEQNSIKDIEKGLSYLEKQQ